MKRGTNPDKRTKKVLKFFYNPKRSGVIFCSFKTFKILAGIKFIKIFTRENMKYALQ